MKKILSPYGHTLDKIKMDVAIIKLAQDLVAIHERFIAKVDEYNSNIDKKIGPKGDKGDLPSEDDIRQVMLKVLTIETLQNLIKPLIPEVRDGINGMDGKNGVSPSLDEIKGIIRKLMPRIDIEEIAERASKKIKPSVVKEIIKQDEGNGLLHLFMSGKIKFKKENIDGLEQTLSAFENQLRNGYLHGGGDTVAAGSGIVITVNSNGTKTITATGSATWYQDETPSGTKNGVNTTFTLAHTPLSVVFLYINGQYQIGGGVQYTRSGTTLTMVDAPLSTDVIIATYS